MSLYGTEVVGTHWPMDGPYPPELVEAAGHAMAELVRYLVRATTRGTGAVLAAEHGGGVLGSLANTAQREIQLCRQLASWAHRLPATPAETETAQQAAAALATAAEVSAELVSHLDRAQGRIDSMADSQPAAGGAPMRARAVLVPDPHTVGLGGPEWAWTGVFGDEVSLAAVPAGEDAPASVALLVCEDIEPFAEVTAYLDPADAREIAGAFVAAAEHAEGGDQP